MNKKTIIILVTLVVIGVVAIVIGGLLSKDKTPVSNLIINNVEDLTTLVDKIYEGVTIEMPMLQTMELDTTDAETFKTFTGLDNTENVEYAVISMPMMNAQAYSMVLLKVKDGADANLIAKTMNENVNERRWICVTAEKIYSTTSGNVVCLVMTNAETAQPVFDSFKTIAGTIGQVYERTAAEEELPPEMY